MSNAIVPVMQSPLHAFSLGAQATRMDASCGVWANELPSFGYISLRGDVSNAAFGQAAARAVGAPLPVAPCTSTRASGVTVHWLSPDEWMIVLPRARLSPVLAALTDALAGTRHQVADNSGGFTQILLLGRNARDVLSHCTVYDPDLLTPGRIVGTTFGKSSVYVYRADDGYGLLLRRSFAGYIWLYMARAAAPYGLGIAKLDPTVPGDAA